MGEIVNEQYRVKVSLREGDDMGPHTYECAKSNIHLDLVWMLGNLFLTFFPKAQPRQTISCIESKLGIPFIIRCKPGSALKWR